MWGAELVGQRAKKKKKQIPDASPFNAPQKLFDPLLKSMDREAFRAAGYSAIDDSKHEPNLYALV